MNWRADPVLLLALLGLLGACGGEPRREPAAETSPAERAGTDTGRQEDTMLETATIPLTSPAFAPNGSIPPQYTCDGRNVSPPLAWGGLPEGTRSLALIVEDPDAPDPRAPRRTWVHWVLYDVPPTITGLSEGASPGRLPAGAKEGRNDFGKTGYGGPCPPIGRHRYFHKLFALDTMLTRLDRPTAAELERAMDGHVLARGELVGTYLRAR